MTNPKPGDRVAVYRSGWSKPFRGVVEKIHPNGMLYVIEDGFNSVHDDSPFHPKQCRRLVKKKREVYLDFKGGEND